MVDGLVYIVGGYRSIIVRKGGYKIGQRHSVPNRHGVIVEGDRERRTADCILRSNYGERDI